MITSSITMTSKKRMEFKNIKRTRKTWVYLFSISICHYTRNQYHLINSHGRYWYIVVAYCYIPTHHLSFTFTHTSNSSVPSRSKAVAWPVRIYEKKGSMDIGFLVHIPSYNDETTSHYLPGATIRFLFLLGRYYYYYFFIVMLWFVFS